MAAVSVGGIYAFGGEVVEFLEVGVPVYSRLENCVKAIGWTDLHYDFLLIGVLEWFGSLDGVFPLCTYQSAPTQASDIPTHN